MLQLTLLGSPSATLDGVPLTDKLLNKELALLYYMAAEDQQNGMPSGHLEHLANTRADCGRAGQRWLFCSGEITLKRPHMPACASPSPTSGSCWAATSPSPATR